MATNFIDDCDGCINYEDDDSYADTNENIDPFDSLDHTDRDTFRKK